MGKSGKAKSSKSSCLEDEEIEEGTEDGDTEEEGTEVPGEEFNFAGGLDLNGDGEPDVDPEGNRKSICQCHPPLRCSSRHHI